MLRGVMGLEGGALWEMAELKQVIGMGSSPI